MNKEEFLDKLTQDNTPVEPFKDRFGLWVSATFIIGIIMVMVMGIRPDLGNIINNTYFWVNDLLLFSTIILAGWAAFATSRPTLFAKKFSLNIIPVALLFISLSVMLFTDFLAHDSAALHIHNGLPCTIMTFVYTLIPFGLLFAFTRKGFSTSPQTTGLMTALASVAAGSLFLSFTCFMTSSTHQLIWHYLPIVLFGSLGYAFGSKLYVPKFN